MLVLCHRKVCPLLQGHPKFLLSRKCHFVQVTSKNSPWTNNRKSHVVTTSIHLCPNVDVMYYQWHIFWIFMKFGIGILMKGTKHVWVVWISPWWQSYLTQGHKWISTWTYHFSSLIWVILGYKISIYNVI